MHFLTQLFRGGLIRLPYGIHIFLLLSLLSTYGFGQTKKLVYKEKNFQLSLFPGVSTNGLYSADFINKFSINLTSGISAGNYYFELGVISNLNIRSTSGIQIAGLANIVGSNSFVNLTRQEEKLLRAEGITSELKGFQFSGLINFVREDVTGAQFSGGFNITQKTVFAVQMAGLANLSRGNVTGTQLSALTNVAIKSMTGFQATLVLNNTRGSMMGAQVGMFNFAKTIQGRHSKFPTKDTGFQFGLINRASNMDGLQIGLINIGKKTRGTQIGLINIYRPGPYDGGVNNKYGTPIGLLNFGSSGSHFRIYTTDVFITNIEYTTGNCYNCSYSQSQMPVRGKFKVLNQNALIYGRNLTGRFNSAIKWGIGYGFQKVLLNKSSMSAFDSDNGRLQISYGLRVLHLNRSKKISRELNLLSRMHAEAGIKFLGIRWFAGAAINFFVSNGERLDIRSDILPATGSLSRQLWPGYTFGIQL
ncbi:MAG: hypothetical protein WBA74_18070 [Cyclobacteriaceae bacterium]